MAEGGGAPQGAGGTPILPGRKGGACQPTRAIQSARWMATEQTRGGRARAASGMAHRTIGLAPELRPRATPLKHGIRPDHDPDGADFSSNRTARKMADLINIIGTATRDGSVNAADPRWRFWGADGKQLVGFGVNGGLRSRVAYVARERAAMVEAVERRIFAETGEAPVWTARAFALAGRKAVIIAPVASTEADLEADCASYIVRSRQRLAADLRAPRAHARRAAAGLRVVSRKRHGRTTYRVVCVDTAQPTHPAVRVTVCSDGATMRDICWSAQPTSDWLPPGCTPPVYGAAQEAAQVFIAAKRPAPARPAHESDATTSPFAALAARYKHEGAINVDHQPNPTRGHSRSD